MAQGVSGNLGWAYYQLGDDDRALELYLEAENTAARLGDIRLNSNGSVMPGMCIAIKAI